MTCLSAVPFIHQCLTMLTINNPKPLNVLSCLPIWLYLCYQTLCYLISKECVLTLVIVSILGMHEDGTRTDDPPWQGNHATWDQTTEDERLQAGPTLYRSEDGGFYIDPSTISSSPIKSFTKISDLGPKQSDMYYNQFSHKQRSGKKQSGATVEGNTWGRPDFDELLPG